MDIFFININTDKYITNTKKIYDQESILNEKYANSIQDLDIDPVEKQEITLIMIGLLPNKYFFNVTSLTVSSLWRWIGAQNFTPYSELLACALIG